MTIYPMTISISGENTGVPRSFSSNVKRPRELGKCLNALLVIHA